MDNQYIVNSVDELPAVAKAIVETINNSNINIVEFYGTMGAGKTTLIREMCRHLGVKDNVTSPTFAIINEYKRGDDDICFHFDFYRLEKIEDAYNLGYEEYLYSGKLCLIEWPEIIEELLPRDDDSINTLQVTIELTGDKSRLISLN